MAATKKKTASPEEIFREKTYRNAFTKEQRCFRVPLEE